MGKLYDSIDGKLAHWLIGQHVFFVATAPRADDGHINCSPKDGPAFRIVDPQTVAYLDLTGSGVETVAHLKENGRIVLMFCAFEGTPKIVRLHGRGEVLEEGHAAFEKFRELWPASHLGVRSIIRVQLDRISDSCGYGVPILRYERDREQLRLWSEKMGDEAVGVYRRKINGQSIDGLPGVNR